MGTGLPVRAAPHRRGRAVTGPIFGGWNGLKAAGAASGVAPADGERSMNTAEPDELNLDLRLEHELQTVAGSSARRCRDFFAYSRHRRDIVPAALFATGTRVAREAPAVLFLEGIGVACSFRRLWRDLAPQEFETGVFKRRPPWFPVSGSHFGGRAGCPNATQPEPVTVSTFFIRPRMGNWQVACALWLDFSKFQAPRRHFCRDLKFH